MGVGQHSQLPPSPCKAGNSPQHGPSARRGGARQPVKNRCHGFERGKPQLLLWESDDGAACKGQAFVSFVEQEVRQSGQSS